MHSALSIVSIAVTAIALMSIDNSSTPSVTGSFHRATSTQGHSGRGRNTDHWWSSPKQNSWNPWNNPGFQWGNQGFRDGRAFSAKDSSTPSTSAKGHAWGQWGQQHSPCDQFCISFYAITQPLNAQDQAKVHACKASPSGSCYQCGPLAHSQHQEFPMVFEVAIANAMQVP